MHAVLAVLAVLATTSADATDAALQQYRGDARGALRRAESLLASTPADLDARLVGTSAAIEAGDLRRANALLLIVERRRPVPARAAVLRRLIERRIRFPDEPLMDALASAWRDAGRPDLSVADPVLAAPLVSPAALPAPIALLAADRLLLSPPGDVEDLRRLAYAAARDAERNSLVANLEILGSLAYQACPSDLTEQRTMVSRTVKAASQVAPENGYVAVAGWLAGCPKELDAAAVALLAESASRREFSYPRERAFQEILSLTERVDAPNARPRAVSAWLALDVPLSRLADLAESVEDCSLRVAAGRAVEAVGMRMADSSAWLERLIGISLAQRGARITKDEDAIARARDRMKRERLVYQEWADAERRMGLWPFAAVWREWTPDEVGASRRLMRLLSQDAR